MSENQTPKPERSLGQEVVRQSTISLAANAAAVVGIVGGFMIVSRLFGKKVDTNDNDTTESETPES